MNEPADKDRQSDPSGSDEVVLRANLAQGDLALRSIAPAIGYLLASQTGSLLNDEIIARIRGMIADIAKQILARQPDGNEFVDHELEALANHLSGNSALLIHCHCLALEWQLTNRLELASGIDMIVTPLVQAQIASGNSEIAPRAAAVLAAQARFIQQMRRMELPLAELPKELFHQVLLDFGTYSCELSSAADEAETTELRNTFDERDSRAGLLVQLLNALGSDRRAALSLHLAGVALFLSAVSQATGQSRDLTVQSFDERQITRLGLTLRIAGLDQTAMEAQLLTLHPGSPLPENLDDLHIDQAAILLAASSSDLI